MKLLIPTIMNPATDRPVRTATATPTGIRLGKKVQPASVVLGLLPTKSERRKVRKQLRSAGFASHAAAVAS